MTNVIEITLNTQQQALVERSLQHGEATSVDELARRALREISGGTVAKLAVPVASARPNPWKDNLKPAAERELLEEFTLEPGTGKAIPMKAGEIIRIQQVDGSQCVDFNVFHLHDYREAFHAGRTRTLHGINPGEGDFLWSAPPRERAMMFILADTAHCNDVMFPRCSANLYETKFGFADHTNCADIQAEAQREFGLTPDDVHDSFNLFMATEVVGSTPIIKRQATNAGDHVELLALMDVLAVPNICGSDVLPTSNFAIRTILVQRFKASQADVDAVPELSEYGTQRTVEQFTQQKIRTERALERDTAYVARFTNVPLQASTFAVNIDTADRDLLEAWWDHDRYATAAEALRDALFTWWMAAHGH